MNLKTEEHKKMFRFDLSESVEHIGRAVAALAADADVLAKTGEIYFVADLARIWLHRRRWQGHPAIPAV